MNNKQAESPLITEQIRVLALQTLPGGKAVPEAQVTAEPKLNTVQAFPIKKKLWLKCW